MVMNDVLLHLHASKLYGKEKGMFKTKKYDHRFRGPVTPVWLLAVTEEDYYYDYYSCWTTNQYYTKYRQKKEKKALEW